MTAKTFRACLSGMEHQTTEIQATGKLRGFTFTGFDGEVFQVRDTLKGLAAIKKALNSPLQALYVREEKNRRGQVVGIFVIAISAEGFLYSHQGSKTMLALLEGLPVRQVKK